MSEVPPKMMNRSSIYSPRSDITEWSSDYKDTSSMNSFECTKKNFSKKRVDFKFDKCYRNKSRITVHNATLSNSSETDTNDEVGKCAPTNKETKTIIALNNKLIKNRGRVCSKTSLLYDKNEDRDYKKFVIEDLEHDETDNEHAKSDDELYDDFDEEEISAAVNTKSNSLVAISSDEVDKGERQKKDLTVEYVEHQLIEAFKNVVRDVILSSSIAQLFRTGGRPNDQKDNDMPEQNYIQQSNRLRVYDSFPSSSSSFASTSRTNLTRSPRMQTPRVERPQRKAFIPRSSSAPFASDRYEEDEKHFIGQGKKCDKSTSKNNSNGSVKNPKKNPSKQISNVSQKSLLEQVRNKTKIYDTHPNGSSSQIKHIDYGKAKKFILKAMARNKANKMNQQPNNKYSSNTCLTNSGNTIKNLNIIMPKMPRINNLCETSAAGKSGEMQIFSKPEDFPFNVKFDTRRNRKRHTKSKQRKSFGFTKERVREIERQNRILLKKILAQRPTFMFDTKPYLNKIREKVGPPAKKLSNSAVNRKKLQRKIDLENRLLKRKIEAILLRRRQL